MVSEKLRGIEGKMQSSVKVFKEDLATIRTGHATPALVEHIKVEYAGVLTPLNQLAGISAPVQPRVVSPEGEGARQVRADFQAHARWPGTAMSASGWLRKGSTR